jgi:hypothetical protein
MKNTGIFLFDLTQILISKKFEKEIRKFCFSLDPDPDWSKMLDPDPDWINPDPQPCLVLFSQTSQSVKFSISPMLMLNLAPGESKKDYSVRALFRNIKPLFKPLLNCWGFWRHNVLVPVSKLQPDG